MEGAATIAARVSGRPAGSVTCVTPVLVAGVVIIALLGMVTSIPTHAYAYAALGLALLGLVAFGTWHMPVVRSSSERYQGHVSVGDWILLDDAPGGPFVLHATPVLARFDHFGLHPGPVIALGLGDGRMIEQLHDGTVSVVELRDVWEARRQPGRPCDDVDSSLGSGEFFELMRQAFCARRPDGKFDWVEIESAALAKGVLSTTKCLRLLEVQKRRGKQIQARCTDAGSVWVLSAFRARGVELIENAARPDPEKGRVAINIEGGSPVGVINLGTVVGSIENHLNQLNVNVPDQAEVQRGLKKLAEGAARDDALSEEEKHDLLESIDFLAEAAHREQADRHPGALRATIRHIAATVATSAALTTLWDVWADPISRFFGIN